MNKFCWKHNRELDLNNYCKDCNDIPPPKPKASGLVIKQASLKLSNALSDCNKNKQHKKWVVLMLENKLRDMIIELDYNIDDEE